MRQKASYELLPPPVKRSRLLIYSAVFSFSASNMSSNIQDKSRLSGAQAGIIISRSLQKIKAIIQDTSDQSLESATFVQVSRERAREPAPVSLMWLRTSKQSQGLPLHLGSCWWGEEILSTGRTEQQLMARHTLLCFAASSPSSGFTEKSRGCFFKRLFLVPLE